MCSGRRFLQGNARRPRTFIQGRECRHVCFSAPLRELNSNGSAADALQRLRRVSPRSLQQSAFHAVWKHDNSPEELTFEPSETQCSGPRSEFLNKISRRRPRFCERFRLSTSETVDSSGQHHPSQSSSHLRTFAVKFENRFEWVGSGPSSRSLLAGGGKRDLPDQKNKPNFQFAEAQHADTLLQIGWIVLGALLWLGSMAIVTLRDPDETLQCGHRN